MVTVDEAIIAKIDKEGKHFEILVDPEIAYELKEGKIVSLSNMLAVNMVFTDAKKGDKASLNDIENIFGNTDIEKVGEEIVKNGEIQITTNFRRKKTGEKKKQIAALISKYALNPQTRVPHPMERIMNAMEKSHLNIDPFQPAEKQVDEVLKYLKELMPISMEEITLNIEVPAKFSGHAYGLIKENATIKADKWVDDGSLILTVSIPAGAKEKLYSLLNSATGGEVKIQEVKK